MAEAAPQTDHAKMRERIASDWEAAAAGWAKWESTLVAFLSPVTQVMLRLADAKPGARVLDVGCGTGEPAISFAREVGQDGSVLAVDVSRRMLDVAKARAKSFHLTNITFKLQAAEDIDESDGRFDAVVSRFGLIFLPDLPDGLRRIRESLAPGGRLCFSVWTPPAVNPVFAIPSVALRNVTKAPAPSPNTPGPFRMAGDGEAEQLLEQAGFEDIRVEQVAVYQCAPDVETYWRLLSEMSVSFRKQYCVMSDDEQQQVRDEVLTALEAYNHQSAVRVPGLARVVVGRCNSR